MNWTEHIEINPKVRFGKPIVKNTRITVYDVLNWLASEMSTKDIIEDFPELTQESIQACLKYAANKESITRIAS